MNPDSAGRDSRTRVMDRDRFERIKRSHGAYASWAVWAQPRGSTRAWVGDPDVLDPDKNPTLLAKLRNDVVMLGLNQSGRPMARALGNFHEYSRHGHDYKIALAFAGTPYWGAYMTDLIKFPELKSSDLARRLAAEPWRVEQSLRTFRQELEDLNGHPPSLIAFGGMTCRLAAKYIPATWYAHLIGVTHYSAWQFTAVEYRERVLIELGDLQRAGVRAP